MSGLPTSPIDSVGTATSPNEPSCSLRTVESHCATRRCRAPRGTASPDAVPQRPDWKSLRSERPSWQFVRREWSSVQCRPLRWTSRAIETRREMGRCGISSRSLDCMASRTRDSSCPTVVRVWIIAFAFGCKCMHFYPCLRSALHFCSVI